MTDKELMQEVLEAMESLHRTGDTQVFDMCAAPVLIPVLRERLAQPEQELVCVCGAIWEGQELVSTPPQRTWVGLTDDEIALICGECAASAHKTDDISYARAIEAKLKEKNNE